MWEKTSETIIHPSCLHYKEVQFHGGAAVFSLNHRRAVQYRAKWEKRKRWGELHCDDLESSVCRASLHLHPVLSAYTAQIHQPHSCTCALIKNITDYFCFIPPEKGFLSEIFKTVVKIIPCFSHIHSAAAFKRHTVSSCGHQWEELQCKRKRERERVHFCHRLRIQCWRAVQSCTEHTANLSKPAGTAHIKQSWENWDDLWGYDTCLYVQHTVCSGNTYSAHKQQLLILLHEKDKERIHHCFFWKAVHSTLKFTFFLLCVVHSWQFPLIVFPLGALKWPKITLFLTAWWVHHIHIKTEPRRIEQSLDACHKFERDPAVRLGRAASYELNCFFFQCEAVCSCSKSPSLMLPTGFGLVLKPQHQCFGQHHVGFLGVRSDQMRMRGWSDEAACTDCISASHRQRYLPNSAK